jgi:hypothetical protein
MELPRVTRQVQSLEFNVTIIRISRNVSIEAGDTFNTPPGPISFIKEKDSSLVGAERNVMSIVLSFSCLLILTAAGFSKISGCAK